MNQILPFMKLQGEQQYITESYVSVPPALVITDEQGAVWTLGFNVAPRDKTPDGEFAFNVLRNGIETGEIASRIERRNGRVRIFTVDGWKTMLRYDDVGIRYIFEITADYLDKETTVEPIKVTIYMAKKKMPILEFSFNTIDGGGWLPDMGQAIACIEDDWLYAEVSPIRLGKKIGIMANDGWGNLTEIPIHQEIILL